MHLAAKCNSAAVLRRMLARGPAAAEARNWRGLTPLQLALQQAACDAARCLLELGPPQPSSELLAAIEGAAWWDAESKPLLFKMVVSHQPLSAADWARVPTPCPCLAAALPVVLQRSEEEAGLLLRHLPRAQCDRLRTLALCLWRVQGSTSAPLPTPIVWRLLALSVAD